MLKNESSSEDQVQVDFGKGDFLFFRLILLLVALSLSQIELWKVSILSPEIWFSFQDVDSATQLRFQFFERKGEGVILILMYEDMKEDSSVKINPNLFPKRIEFPKHFFNLLTLRDTSYLSQIYCQNLNIIF